MWPSAWAGAGTQLVVSLTSVTNVAPDIVAIRLQGGKAEPLFAAAGVESQPTVEANGEWIAYMAIRSGRPDVYVERFPALSDRRTVSTDGGVLPAWSKNSRELYYYRIASSEMMVVPITGLRPQLVLGPPKPLFKVALPQIRPSRPYDVMPDGRFIMIVRSESAQGDVAATSPIVVQNWGEELKRRVPVH